MCRLNRLREISARMYEKAVFVYNEVYNLIEVGEKRFFKGLIIQGQQKAVRFVCLISWYSFKRQIIN